MDTSDKKNKIVNSESSSKEEKKTRRLSGTHHLLHHHEKHGEKEKSEEKSKEKHDKQYYKKKYEEEHKFKSELAEVVKKLNATNEALRNEVETLKSQAHAVTETKIPEIKPQTPTEPEPVSFSKVDGNSTEEKPITENPTDSPTINTPKPTSEPSASYWDSVSNGLGVLSSYMPNFSGITSKIPSIPRVFEPVPNHHDPVSKPKI